MTVLLTKKKANWARSRSTKQLRGTPLPPNAAVAQRYAAVIERAITEMTRETNREIIKLMRSQTADAYFAEDADIGSQARILTNALMDKFNGLFDGVAKMAAKRMAKQTEEASQSSLHGSLKDLSGGLSIKTDVLRGQMQPVITASIAENVGLIKSIPVEYMPRVRTAVMKSIMSGGLQTLVPALKKSGQITQRHAELMAMDQTRKLYSAINVHRMKALGIKQFQWHHSASSQQPRKDHIEMDGKIYSFDSPPVIDRKTGERGFPGQAINCRCFMSPVIEFSGDDE